MCYQYISGIKFLQTSGEMNCPYCVNNFALSHMTHCIASSKVTCSGVQCLALSTVPTSMHRAYLACLCCCRNVLVLCNSRRWSQVLA